jgi:hypothetical protein
MRSYVQRQLGCGDHEGCGRKGFYRSFTYFSFNLSERRGVQVLELASSTEKLTLLFVQPVPVAIQTELFRLPPPET